MGEKWNQVSGISLALTVYNWLGNDSWLEPMQRGLEVIGRVSQVRKFTSIL
jgi:hypothetical protein